MRCVNCGRELPPDTAECPFCIEKEKQKGAHKHERRKVFFTLGICALILALIATGLLVFMPRSTFQRDLENAQSSYSIAALCESAPEEAGNSKYQLRLLNAVDDIEERYNNQSCGYNQTITALKQLYGVENAVVRDRTEAVWANVERMRLYQLMNHARTESGLPELTWEPDTAAAAESIADEYSTAGMTYQENMERLIKTMLPDATEVFTSTLLNTINAQDALSKYQGDTTQDDGVNLLNDTSYKQIGIGAAYDAEHNLWSFFLLAQP